ncbi:4'-phosphopantetheinyl transferase family protein [Oleiagrimonas soli]|nr:4'-phosphopantetheinyl transferase superfamily protein [Oleiagrimonas soli]
MHEHHPDCATAIVTEPNVHSTVAPDAMIRDAYWEPLGHDDPRMPPACVIAFDPTAFDASAWRRHEVRQPSALLHAVPKRQAEFLTGRIAARQAIARLGLAASIPGIGASREPRWQNGVAGSITHVHGLAAAVAVAASNINGIGIDVERIVDAATRDALRGTVVTTDEYALLKTACSRFDADLLLTTVFSAKESFFKGAFATVGRYFEFEAARLSSLDADTGRLQLTLTQTLHPTLPEGRVFTIGFRMLAADTVVTSFIW